MAGVRGCWTEDPCFVRRTEIPCARERGKHPSSVAVFVVSSGPTWVAPGTHRRDQTRRFSGPESALFHGVVCGYWVVGPAGDTYRNLVKHDRTRMHTSTQTNRTILLWDEGSHTGIRLISFLFGGPLPCSFHSIPFSALSKWTLW